MLCDTVFEIERKQLVVLICALPITSLLLHRHVSRGKIRYCGIRIFSTGLQKLLTVEIAGSVHVQIENL